MSSTALLTLAAVAAYAIPQPQSGVQVMQAQLSVTILKAAVVRHATGPEIAPETAPPQITRRDGKVLVEYQ